MAARKYVLLYYSVNDTPVNAAAAAEVLGQRLKRAFQHAGQDKLMMMMMMTALSVPLDTQSLGERQQKTTAQMNGTVQCTIQCVQQCQARVDLAV